MDFRLSAGIFFFFTYYALQILNWFFFFFFFLQIEYLGQLCCQMMVSIFLFVYIFCCTGSSLLLHGLSLVLSE